MQQYKAAEPRLEQFCRRASCGSRIDAKSPLTLPVETNESSPAGTQGSVQPVQPKICPLFKPPTSGQLVSRCTSVAVCRNQEDYVTVEQSIPAELRRQGELLGLCDPSVGDSEGSVNGAVNGAVNGSVKGVLRNSQKDALKNFQMTSQVNPKVNPQVTSQVNPQVTSQKGEMPAKEGRQEEPADGDGSCAKPEDCEGERKG